VEEQEDGSHSRSTADRFRREYESSRMPTRLVAISRGIAAGLGGALVTILLLFIWFRIQSAIIWRSAYTDLPGQDSHQLTLDLEKYVVIGVIALIAGRIGGLLCPAARRLAAVLGVSPLLIGFTVSGTPFNQWYWYAFAPVLALIGAYAPVWMSRSPRRATEDA
jgi:hypothetical protein